MTPILAALVAVTAAFAALLVVKSLARWRFCVICAAVSLTWLVLLVMERLGRFGDPVVVALLMGQTVVGAYYLVEKRVREDLLVFRLPFLLTATFAAYVAVGRPVGVAAPLFLGAVWLLLYGVYAYRSSERVKGMVRRLVDCCRNW